jgi:hypothetical protein
MLKTALTGLAFTILLWQPAAAQSQKNYIGIGLRSFSTDNDDAGFNDGEDIEAKGIQVTFGQRLNRFWAWELNFIRDSYDSLEFTSDNDIDFQIDAEADQFGLSFIYSPNVYSDVTPYIRFGYAERDYKADFTASRGRTEVSGSIDSFEADDGTWWGLGLRITGSRKFDIIIEASRFTSDAEGVYIGPQFYF